MSSWREFLRDNSATLGVTLFFAAMGSGFLLYSSASKSPVTGGRAFMVIFAGQIVGTCATTFCFGYLGWNLFVAPAVGTACGLVGIFAMMTGVKVGQRVEDRGSDIADIGIHIAGRGKEDGR